MVFRRLNRLEESVMRRTWIRRSLAITASTAMGVAACVATSTPAAADDVTMVRITGPTTIIVGTKSPIRFTVAGTIVTNDPTQTDIQWSLQGGSSNCFMFNSGDTTGKSSNTFSDHDYLAPAELINDCEGSAVLDVDAFDPSNDGGSDSSTRTVKILRAARWESFNAHPEPIHTGGTLHIDGTLQRANWDDGTYHRYTQHTAELQFRTMTGSYASVRTVSGSTGDFSAKETQKVSGCWRYVFEGSSTTGPATTAGDCVTVH
jgi:hypothetical protein